MPSYETEKIKCRDVRVGDLISYANNRTCDMLVRDIEEHHTILRFLPARKLFLGNETETTFVSRFGPGKPMRRRVV
ncbi:MAG: hypothetical protein AAGA37_15840 [Actinomycetota bacterium]